MASGSAIVGADPADRKPEEAVDLPHPLGVAAGQVVVHGHEVDAAAAERVQVDGQSRDEGLALTGLHLCDPAEVQRHAPHQLDVEVSLSEDPPSCLTDGGKGLNEEVVEVLPLSSLSSSSRVRCASSSSDVASTSARVR